MSTTATGGARAAAVFALGGVAAAGDPLLTTECVTDTLELPVALAAAPGDVSRLFVVEQPGRIVVVDLETGDVLPAPFLDISDRLPDISGQMRGLAFDPQYDRNGHIYVHYTGGSGPDSLTAVIARFTVALDAPDRADPGSEHVVLTFDRPGASHQGGWLGFDSDGYLHASFGDGGEPCLALELSGDHHLGRVIRLDVHGDDFPADPHRNYAIPPDNPFVGDPGINDETWVVGLRHPWGVAFDRETGDLYLGDVGSNLREEIDVVPAGSGGGQNFGWPCFEGTECNDWCFPEICGATECDDEGLEPPIHEYDNAGTGDVAIIGGTVYRGTRLGGLQGAYVFADFRGLAWSLRYRGGRVTELREHTRELDPHGPATLWATANLGTDAAGELYILQNAPGVLRRIVEDTCPQDTNDDGAVGVDDLVAVILAWGTDEPDTDVDHDGTVDNEDLIAVILGWGPC